MTRLRVPGYDVVELIGRGGAGEVWLARDQATGEPVALKRVRDPGDLASRDRLRREAAALACVTHPHMVRLRGVVGLEDALVLVLDLASGGSLARLLGQRGRLSAGEVVTLAVPLAQALAAAHAQGLVHGDVTPANVLFTGEGRPMLGDLGVARLIGVPADGPGDPGDAGGTGCIAGTAGYRDPALDVGPAGDVHGLAATCVAALTGVPPYDGSGARVAPPPGGEALWRVLEAALDPDPARRPGAAELAVDVFESTAARPVRMVGDLLGGPAAAVPSPELMARDLAVPDLAVPDLAVPDLAVPDLAPPTHRAALAAGGRRRRPRHPARRRHRGRGLLAVAGAALAVVLAAAGGIVWAATEEEPSAGAVTASAAAAAADRDAPGDDPAQPATAAPTPTPSSAAGDWARVLARLDATRSRAFARGDPGVLAAVYAPGSPAGARDRVTLAQLVATGLRAEGLSIETLSVTPADPVRPPGRHAVREVRLRVVDVLAAYRLVAPSGREEALRPGRGPRRWTVTLRQVGPGWRIHDVQRR